MHVSQRCWLCPDLGGRDTKSRLDCALLVASTPKRATIVGELVAVFTIAGYYNDLFVGVVGCRPERRDDGKQRLYVAVLAVLPAYRGLGLGTKMLNSVLEQLPKHDQYVEVYLHVHTPNTRAAALYERLGFENVGVIKGYYTAAELAPPDCVLLRYMVGDAEPTVDLQHGGLGAPVAVIPEATAASASAAE